MNFTQADSAQVNAYGCYPVGKYHDSIISFTTDDLQLRLNTHAGLVKKDKGA